MNLSNVVKIVIVSCLFFGCTKVEWSKKGTLKKMYRKYKTGAIDECNCEGSIIYVGADNAYDGGSTVYNDKGKVIGNCNWSWGGPTDSICFQLNDCEEIYCHKDNIWGHEPVDKYNLKGSIY